MATKRLRKEDFESNDGFSTVAEPTEAGTVKRPADKDQGENAEVEHLDGEDGQNSGPATEILKVLADMQEEERRERAQRLAEDDDKSEDESDEDEKSDDDKDDEDDDKPDFLKEDDEDDKSDEDKDGDSEDDKSDDEDEDDKPDFLKEDDEDEKSDESDDDDKSDDEDDKSDDEDDKSDDEDEKDSRVVQEDDEHEPDEENDEDEKSDDKDKPDSDPASDEIKVNIESLKLENLRISVGIEGLFEGKDLSAGAKAKTKRIFEAAVLANVNRMAKKIAAVAEQKAAEAVALREQAMVKKLDGYCNYVVSEFMKENRVAIDSGIMVEQHSKFMKGLKKLFTEHHWHVPAGQDNVVERLARYTAKVQSKLNESMKAQAKLMKRLEESERNDIIAELSEGLTDVQADKLSTLAEGVDFRSPREFGRRLNELREGLVATHRRTRRSDRQFITEDRAPINQGEDDAQGDPIVESVALHLERSVGKGL